MTNERPILIAGASGFLGSRIADYLERTPLGPRVVTPPRGMYDYPDRIRRLAPAIVINAAGVTGHPNVDWCETRPAATVLGNTLLPIQMAYACEAVGAKMIHLSSGCVFFGTRPGGGSWRTDDAANPHTVYTRAKYAADLALRAMGGVAVCRLRMPLDDRPHKRNLITKLLGYDAIVEARNSVTFVSSLVRGVAALCEDFQPGVYHMVNPGSLGNWQIRDAIDSHLMAVGIVSPGYVTRARGDSRNLWGARSEAALEPLWPRNVRLDPAPALLGPACETYAAHVAAERRRQS